MSFGQEILVAGSQKEMDEHYKRAHVYAKDHSVQVLCLNISMSNKPTGKKLQIPPETEKASISDFDLNTAFQRIVVSLIMGKRNL